MEEVKACFARCDASGEGTIDRGSLVTVLQALKPSVDLGALDELLSKVEADAKGSRRIWYGPFVDLLCQEISAELQAEAIFLALDTKREGQLDVTALLKEEERDEAAPENPLLQLARRLLAESCSASTSTILDLAAWQELLQGNGRCGQEEMEGLKEMARQRLSQRLRDLAITLSVQSGRSASRQEEKQSLAAFLEGIQSSCRNEALASSVARLRESLAEPDASDAADTAANGGIQNWRTRFAHRALAAVKLELLVQALLVCEAAMEAQLQQRYEAVFSAIDSDCSGGLDKMEIIQYMAATGLPERSAAAAAAVLEQSCDTNKDGKVTLAEWKAMFAADWEKKGAEGAAWTLCWFERIAGDFLTNRGEKAYQRFVSLLGSTEEAGLLKQELLAKAEMGLRAGRLASTSHFGESSLVPAATRALEALRVLPELPSGCVSRTQWREMLTEHSGGADLPELLAGLDALCLWIEQRGGGSGQGQ